MAGNPWPVLDVKESVWCAMTKGGQAPSATPSWRVSHIVLYAGACVMGIFDDDRSLGGGG